MIFGCDRRDKLGTNWGQIGTNWGSAHSERRDNLGGRYVLIHITQFVPSDAGQISDLSLPKKEEGSEVR
jgi:hypothetical protein